MWRSGKLGGVPEGYIYIYICVCVSNPGLLPQKFAFTMGWVVAAAESLMFINVLVGCIIVRRKI